MPGVKITLEGETRLRVENAAGTLTIEAPSAERRYEPFDMLASSLGVCTHAVLSSWASQSRMDSTGLVVYVEWTVDDQHLMKTIDVSFEWPGLPETRIRAAHRAASLCSIHSALTAPPQITIRKAG